MAKTTKPTTYTLEFVQEEARSALRFFQENEGALFLNEFILTRDYHPNRWAEWQKKYREDEQFTGLVQKVKMLLEIRLAKSGFGIGCATMAIFCLANNYGWSRKDREAPPPPPDPEKAVRLYLPQNGR